MSNGFDAALARVLKHEGGYVNHPKDPGGATNKGVTQGTYDDWRGRKGLALRSVRSIESDEIAAIYRRDYWDAVKADKLPAGLAYCVFDFAVNSGVKRAARYLQKAAGVAQDSVIGPKTIAAAKAVPEATMIDRICNARLGFLRLLGTYHVFGRGWSRRVAEVRADAKALAK